MEEFPAYSVDAPELSTREILKDSGIDPLLAEMLLCPTCYYGSARHDDIDFPTFVMLFDAIFRQGLARPEQGIRAILDPLCKKSKELGVDRRMNTGVRKFHVHDNEITKIELESGEYVFAEKIISTCGVLETEALLSLPPQCVNQPELGQFSIIETISILKGEPKELNWEETVIFFNDSEKFDYMAPQNPVDLRSGVICIPENYKSSNNPTEFKLRITHPANFGFWNSLAKEKYLIEKEKYENRIFQNGFGYLNDTETSMDAITKRVILRDTFTPKTIKRFTSHENGTLYGSPTKSRDGSTKLKNLFLAGTDQGYIGIVGAMLGGIAVANNQILRSA
jgi:phytoene dehydrogenase-like protein